MDTVHLQQRLSTFPSPQGKPLIVVLGPTASGKTAFSIELAIALPEVGASIQPAEIINADSRQLYKELDVGTAKITREEMKGVPHFLLDVLDPREEANAAWYKARAEEKIADIHANGHIPILVGGSMLYLSAVIDGLEFPSPPDPKLRAALEADYDMDGGESLYAQLLEIDADTAVAFSRNNKPYVIRAMEMYASTGRKPSEAKKKSPCPYELLMIGIERSPEDLNKRIADRTAKLFDQGWIGEVEKLLKEGYSPEDPAMKSHGYREIIGYLQTGKPSLTQLQEQISTKTRQYAKRQMTWWRNDQRILWVTP